MAGAVLDRSRSSDRSIRTGPSPSQDQGVFHSPSPLPDGRILVSRLSNGGEGTYGVGILDPENGRFDPLFDDPQRHDIQAKAICPRPEPDGRSSVVTEEDPNGKLYCLSVYTHDLRKSELPRGSVKRLRVLEGIPVRGESGAGVPTATGFPLWRRGGYSERCPLQQTARSTSRSPPTRRSSSRSWTIRAWPCGVVAGSGPRITSREAVSAAMRTGNWRRRTSWHRP